MAIPDETDPIRSPHVNHHVPVVGIWWWAILVIAVLAVPSFGFIVSLMVPVNGYSILAVFIIACWLCTYLGIKLMQPKK